MIPFSPPRIDQKIIDEVVTTLQSGWITTGPKTKLLEKKLTEYCGSKSTLCINSATAGLELALRWFGVKEGDEVIVPAYTYCATANVVIHCGARPVLVDVGNDFNISVAEIEKAITPKTKVIIPVDFSGFPCDYDRINALVKKPDILKFYNPATDEQRKLGRILLLADAAHSIGAIYNGKKTGTLADISVFSFHAVKNLTTAEGGAISLCLPSPFNNEELYKALCLKSLHGQNKDALAKFKKGEWKYDIVEAGYKCNMTDIQAAIGLVELDRYETETLRKRREIFELYTSVFSNYKWAQVPVFENKEATSSFHLYALRIKNINEEQRNRIISKIFEKDVSVNVHFMPLPMFSFYKKIGYRIENFPVAYDNYAREISLPVYYNLAEEQVKFIAEVVAMAVEDTL